MKNNSDLELLMTMARKPTDTVEAFLNANQDLYIETIDTLAGRALIEPIERNGRLQIAILLGDDTGHGDLREANRLALEWNRRLIEWQGLDFNAEDRSLNQLYKQHEQFKRGESQYGSWADLTNQLNQEIGKLLITAVEFTQLREAAKSRKNFPLYADSDYNRRVNLNKVRRLLDCFIPSDEEIEVVINEVLDNILNNAPPFSVGYPVEKRRLERKVTNWAKTHT